MSTLAGRRRHLPAPVLMVLASALFALMGVCVKYASASYPSGDIVFYRSLVGATVIVVMSRWRGVSLKTAFPAMHFWRCVAGVGGLCLWFYAIGGLPLATAMTLNTMSSVWMALFMAGGTVLMGTRSRGIDGRLIAAIVAGFAGVALVLRPTLEQQQLWHGLCGLLSGMLAAVAYLQVTALGRIGEPEERIVFFFSLGGIGAGAVAMGWSGGPRPHSGTGLALLLAIGLLATAAQLMMTRAYAIGRPLSNAALQYLGVAFSVVLGAWLFDDPLTGSILLGIALIVGAGYASTRLRAKLPAAAPGVPSGGSTDT